MKEAKPFHAPSKRQLLVQRLRKAALPAIAEQGLDNLTADDLAEVLQISRRSFFRYFPTKEDVVVGAFADVGDRLVAAFASNHDSGALGFSVIEGLLVEAMRGDEFYEPAGRALFALITESPALRARFLSLLERSADQFNRSISRRLGAKHGSLFVRLTLTLLVEATDRWSKSASRRIEDQIHDVVEEARKLA